MTKKRVSTMAGIVLGLAGAWYAAALIAPENGPGVTKANFDKIEKGMSFSEVQGIFGGKRPSELCGRPWAFCAEWQSDSGATAEVTFEGRLAETELRVISKEWRSAISVKLEELAIWLRS